MSTDTSTRTLWMIENTDEWPIWPILPVKQSDPAMRRRPDGLGFMVAVRARRWHVYLGLIGDIRADEPLRTQLERLDCISYNNAETLVADGWIVD